MSDTDIPVAEEPWGTEEMDSCAMAEWAITNLLDWHLAELRAMKDKGGVDPSIRSNEIHRTVSKVVGHLKGVDTGLNTDFFADYVNHTLGRELHSLLNVMAKDFNAGRFDRD